MAIDLYEPLLVAAVAPLHPTCPGCLSLMGELAVARASLREAQSVIATLKSDLAAAQERAVAAEAEATALESQLTAANAARVAAQEMAFKPPERMPALEDPHAGGDGPRPRGQQRGAPGHGRRRHDNLPTQDVDLGLPEDDLYCPNCHAPYEEIPITTDAEVIDWRQDVCRVIHHRRRYRRTCRCAQAKPILKAPAPLRPIARGMLSSGFLAHLLVFKFALGMPLERILLALSYAGLDLSPGSVTGMFESLAKLLAPLYVAFLEHHYQQAYWRVDETRWKVYTDHNLTWSSPNAWLWGAVSADVTVFIIDPHRSSDALLRLFPSDQASRIAGVIQSDMYATYGPGTLDPARFQLAKCWAHVRRHIYRASRTNPALTLWADAWLARIATMYGLLRDRRHHPNDPARQAAIEAQMKSMRRTVTRQLNKPPAPQAIKVLEMMACYWPELVAFVVRPEIAPDNNAAERAMRRPALGRKNYVGSRAPWAADLAAMMFSLAGTLQRWRRDPVDYLTRYLTACASAQGGAVDLAPFLPWNSSDCAAPP